MSASEQRAGAAPRSRRVDLALALGVFVAIFAATLPLLRVIDSGPWVPGALGLTAAVLGAGFTARWFRLPGIVVSLIEILVWIALLTAVFGRGTAFFWVIPTAETFSLASGFVQSAVENVALGAAPLDAAPALSFLVVAAVGLLAVALDHVVVTARMPLLAAVGLVAISLVPSLAVPGDVDAVAFILLAVSILFLLAVDTRARQRARAEGAGTAEPQMKPARMASGTAVGIGAVAIVVAMVAGPLLPAPQARAGSGIGVGGNTIDPTLELGDDLRQPQPVEVMKVRPTAGETPYLRIATLTEFDGAVWEPDEGDVLPLDNAAPELDPVVVDEGIEVEEHRATVEIVDLNSRWAPVPYPAIEVTGLDGEWSVLPDNRTVAAESDSVQGQTYETVAAVPAPTLEQIRARSAGGVGDEDVYELPDDMPAIIAETAQEVTADARTDYDALTSLQAWFRGTSFDYSLEAPVSEGFDDTGVEAIADFLEVREGYCVHFASAFAVMARTLGMPARIVVGYLPGTTASTSPDAPYTVLSSQLHAWPEVYFDGIGWVPFEPTNSLGDPTDFTSSSSTTPGSVASPSPTRDAALPTPTPTSTPTGPAAADRDPGATNRGGTAASANPWPALGVSFAVLLLLAAPGVFREVRRRRLFAAARRGDATAAWLSVQELAIDLGIPAPASESPRAFGTRLTRQRGADAAAMSVLVGAIERASYAGDSSPQSEDGWADAVTAVSTSLLGTVSPARRWTALVVPRSLLIRPGSAYAGLRPPPARETTA